MKKKYLIIVIISHFVVNTLLTQIHPLPRLALENFQLEVGVLELDDLGKSLVDETHFQKFDIILKELNTREKSEVLKIYNYYLKNDKVREGHFNKKMHNIFKAKVLMQRIKANTTNQDFLMDSIKYYLNQNNNPALIDEIAVELRLIGGNKSLDILKEFEKNKISLKINKLLLETSGFSDELYIEHLLNSARETILRLPEDKLVSERTLLNKKWNSQYLKNKIKSEINSPSWTVDVKDEEKKYYQSFLKEFSLHLENLRKPNTHTHKESKKPPIKEDINSGKKNSKITLPEEKGKNLSSVSVNELINIFENENFSRIYKNKQNWKNPKCIELRKAAQVLGDRSIEGTLVLTNYQQRKIDRLVSNYLELSLQNNFSEAKSQIQKLWHLAIPSLIKNLEHEEGSIMDMAAQMLSYCKNEKVVEIIITKAKEPSTLKQKLRYRNTLMGMKNYYPVNGVKREKLGLTKKETIELYERKIAPFLVELESEIKQMRMTND